MSEPNSYRGITTLDKAQMLLTIVYTSPLCLRILACFVRCLRLLTNHQAKRDKGQASRGKSYVEEEKRLLRELGSS